MDIRKQNYTDLVMLEEKLNKRSNLEFLHNGFVSRDTEVGLKNVRLEIRKSNCLKFSVAGGLGF